MNPFRHVQSLANEIGARPATSEKERRAHDYIRQMLESLSIPARVEEFRSIRSFTAPWLVTSLLFLFGGGLIWLGDAIWIRVTAFASILTADRLFWGMVSGTRDVQKRFPQGDSRNVMGVLAPAGKVRHRVVLMAHVDSTRACLLWHPKMVKNFGSGFVIQAVMLALMLWGAVFALFHFKPWGFDPRWLTVPGMVISVWGVFVLVHRETALHWVQGANDNASGVAVCLSVMETLRHHPLKQTEVWAVFTGCEEVGAPVGAQAFLKAHRDELRDARMVVVDNVGAGDPRYLTGEAMPRRHAHPQMLALATQLARQHPEWHFQPSVVPYGAYTDALPFMLNRNKVIALWSEKDGALPNWHWHTDTIERVEPEALEKMGEVVLAMVQSIDESG